MARSITFITPTGNLLLIASAGGALLVIVVAWAAWRRRRSTVRRLASVTTRLEHGGSATTTDVTGRGSVEAALAGLERAAGGGAMREREATTAGERLAAALQAIPHAVLVCDESGEVVHRNQRAEQLVGDRLDGALAAPAVRSALDQATAGTATSDTIELFGPPPRVLRVTATPLAGDLRPLGAVAVVEDVSERRRLDDVRRDFVANISHELKTPVGALGLLAETLAEEPDESVARRLAARMQDQAHRVGRIIEDLLDLSRIESEESPRREPVAVHLVLAEAADRLRPLAELRDVALEIEEPSRRITVLGDRRQLVSALHSLVENAVLYSSPGDPVKAVVHTNGQWVEVTVIDRGIGIPTRDLERVFERFYRVDRARSRETGGTGLGLAIVRHVANNHGGEVRVQSQEGRGSTFTLRLPAGPGPVAVSVSDRGDADAGESVTA